MKGGGRCARTRLFRRLVGDLSWRSLAALGVLSGNHGVPPDYESQPCTPTS